jgi:hypothetical protein
MSAPRTLAGVVPAIAAKAMGRRGLAFGPLLSDWSSIVGAWLAERCVPFKLTFPPGRRTDAVLHLKIESSAALELQHCEAQVLERINAFFGYGAVARLKLLQAPPMIARRTRPLLVPDAVRLAALTGGLNSVTDPALKERLENLARAMSARTPP